MQQFTACILNMNSISCMATVWGVNVAICAICAVLDMVQGNSSSYWLSFEVGIADTCSLCFELSDYWLIGWSKYWLGSKVIEWLSRWFCHGGWRYQERDVGRLKGRQVGTEVGFWIGWGEEWNVGSNKQISWSKRLLCWRIESRSWNWLFQ